MALHNMIHNVRDIVEAPLTEPLSMTHLFLMVGVVIVAWGFWIMIIAHIRGAVEAVAS